MESRRYLLPSEEHHSHEGRFHEEGHDTLYGQWCSEDVAYKPGIVRPVGTKLKLQDDTCSHTHGEVDAKQLLPELCYVAPESVARAIPTSLGNAHNHR